jgi:hypothetical protein
MQDVKWKHRKMRQPTHEVNADGADVAVHIRIILDGHKESQQDPYARLCSDVEQKERWDDQ